MANLSTICATSPPRAPAASDTLDAAKLTLAMDEQHVRRLRPPAARRRAAVSAPRRDRPLASEFDQCSSRGEDGFYASALVLSRQTRSERAAAQANALRAKRHSPAGAAEGSRQAIARASDLGLRPDGAPALYAVMPMHHAVVRWTAWRCAIGPGQERLSPAGRPSPTPVPSVRSICFGVVVNWPSVGLTDEFLRAVLVCTPTTDPRELTPCGN
jgi:hypothetical protein